MRPIVPVVPSASQLARRGGAAGGDGDGRRVTVAEGIGRDGDPQCAPPVREQARDLAHHALDVERRARDLDADRLAPAVIEIVRPPFACAGALYPVDVSGDLLAHHLDRGDALAGWPLDHHALQHDASEAALPPDVVGDHADDERRDDEQGAPFQIFLSSASWAMAIA